MNKLFHCVAVSLLLLSVKLTAQQNTQVSKAQMQLFTKSTTYIVMDNNPMLGYNITVKAAVEKYWKITPYKFITLEAFDSLRKDPAKSFMLLTKVTLTKDKANVEYLYLNVLMGANVNSIDDMPEILNLPLSYSGVDDNGYSYKMGVMVRFAQEHARALASASRLVPYRNLKYYNKNVIEIKKKTLLVEKSDLSEEVNTPDKIKALYPYDVRFVTMADIEKAVIEQTPNTLILHQISPSEDDKIGRSYKIIYGVDDNKIYYFNFEKISERRPAGFLAKDFKRIAGDM